jgi:hypothetical protein
MNMDYSWAGEKPQGSSTNAHDALARILVMDPETQMPAADRPCPLPFVVAPAFVVALLWLCAMLARMTH